MPEADRRRRYHSPRRREQAAATRRAVLDAARDLFVQRGYVSTTIDAIAGSARVSPETVYATFGTKRALLAQLADVPPAAGDGPPPILERSWVRRLRGERDLHRRLLRLARESAATLRRRAAVDEVLRGAAAADSEIAALWERARRDRLVGQRALLEVVVGDAALPRGIDIEAAAAAFHAIGSPETYRLLVADRGWTDDRYERWFGATLARLLVDDAAPS
jgi:TetR/AcrR family transcriptional regulator of autoinduction and epiphytic fitness